MKQLHPLSGVVAIPQTPFDERDRIDLDSLGRGVEDRLAAGVDGLLYPVVASEVARLSPAERRLATRAVLERVGDRVPVIVGASADDPRAVRSIAEDATARGAAGVLVQTPIGILRDERATVAFFRAVCEAPIDTLMIQDLEWNGPGLPIATIHCFADFLTAARSIETGELAVAPRAVELAPLESGPVLLRTDGGGRKRILVPGLA